MNVAQGGRESGLPPVGEVGLADTDMTAGWTVDKMAPADLADAALDGVEAGSAEALADQWSRDVKSRLPLTPQEFNAAMVRALAALTAV